MGGRTGKRADPKNLWTCPKCETTFAKYAFKKSDGCPGCNLMKDSSGKSRSDTQR